MSVFKRWNGTSWETIGPQVTSTRFNDINHMIAPEYSSTSTYNVGDYVVQSDKLYKCISAIESAEEWNAAHWETSNFGDELNRKTSALKTYISTGVYQLLSNDFEDGGWNFETGEKIDQWRAIRTKKAYTLKAGDRFIFNTAPLYIAYSIIDAYGNVLYTNFGDSFWKKAVGEYVATESCSLYISMRNSYNAGNSNPISPSDMTSKLVIDDSWWTHEINDFDNAFDKLSLNVDGKDVFDSSKFAVGSLDNGQFVTTGYFAFMLRVATPNALNYQYNISLTAQTGYRFGINYFNDNDTFIFDSGWQTSYTIPANQNFRITIAKQSESSSDPVLNNLDIPTFVKKVEFNTKLAGEINPHYTFNANGTYINLNKQRFNISATGIIPRAWSDIQIANVASTQGFAICNEVIFQLYSDDVVVLIDKDTGTIIAELPITSGHGNTIAFSNEYYSNDDEFPLVYITAESNPPKIYVNRITRSSTTLIRTYKFSYETVGYYANHCLDALNNKLYMCGYTMDSYTSDENGQNKMLFTEWDISNSTLNNDGTYTPSLIKLFYLPFINTHQGNEIHDGYIWMMSSSGSGQVGKTTRIYVINPFSERIEKIISDFPNSIATEECEGLMFVEDTDKYNIWILRRVENENYISLSFS